MEVYIVILLILEKADIFDIAVIVTLSYCDTKIAWESFESHRNDQFKVMK